jgi:hypothetical protein
MYIDEETTNAVVNSNITYNCQRPLMWHRVTNSMCLNNYFVNTRAEDMWLHFHNSETTNGHGAILFQQNIIRSAQKIVIDAQTGYRGFGSLDKNLAVNDWHNNITWSMGGQNSLNPTNATTADPLFADVPTDSSFQAGSPAPGLGIHPPSLIGIGYNGSQMKQVLLPASDLHVLPPRP